MIPFDIAPQILEVVFIPFIFLLFSSDGIISLDRSKERETFIFFYLKFCFVFYKSSGGQRAWGKKRTRGTGKKKRSSQTAFIKLTLSGSVAHEPIFLTFRSCLFVSLLGLMYPKNIEFHCGGLLFSTYAVRHL